LFAFLSFVAASASPALAWRALTAIANLAAAWLSVVLRASVPPAGV
jgi:hypothetical protein